MKIPPGIAHIPSLLSLLLPPPAFAYLLVRVAQEYLGWRIHTAVYLLALILSYPASFAHSRISSTLWRNWRAKKIGAVSPPAVRGRPLSIIHKLSVELTDGYPGSYSLGKVEIISLSLANVFQQWVDTYGQTYSLSLTEYCVTIQWCDTGGY